MKKINILVLLILAIVSQLSLAKAQAPQAIPYQAAARNAQGLVLANQSIKVRFTLIDSIAGGVVLYSETHQTTTNALGLFNLNFGTGIIVSGSFTTFDWSKNNKFFKVELDTSATGNSYVDLGTQQLLSVPYSLHSKTAESLGGKRNQGSDVKTLIYLMDGF